MIVFLVFLFKRVLDLWFLLVWGVGRGVHRVGRHFSRVFFESGLQGRLPFRFFRQGLTR